MFFDHDTHLLRCEIASRDTRITLPLPSASQGGQAEWMEKIKGIMNRLIIDNETEQ
jgi:hypothetical protein